MQINYCMKIHHRSESKQSLRDLKVKITMKTKKETPGVGIGKKPKTSHLMYNLPAGRWLFLVLISEMILSRWPLTVD